MRGRRLDQLDPYLAPPWREQFSRAEEARQDQEVEWLEENSWLTELEPDPYDDPTGEAA